MYMDIAYYNSFFFFSFLLVQLVQFGGSTILCLNVFICLSLRIFICPFLLLCAITFITGLFS